MATWVSPEPDYKIVGGFQGESRPIGLDAQNLHFAFYELAKWLLWVELHDQADKEEQTVPSKLENLTSQV
jgi:hypothetical protein